MPESSYIVTIVLVDVGLTAGIELDSAQTVSPLINNGLAILSLYAALLELTSVFATPYPNFLNRKSIFCVSDIAINLPHQYLMQ